MAQKKKDLSVLREEYADWETYDGTHGSDQLHRIFLMSSEGMTNNEISEALGITPQMVSIYKSRPTYVHLFRQIFTIRAQNNADQAYRVLLDIATDPEAPASTRREASRDILKLAGIIEENNALNIVQQPAVANQINLGERGMDELREIAKTLSKPKLVEGLRDD